ncbi:MAG: hypothetical protein AAF810_19515 [Cyanobacteria bacterium P01_D01_bin.36]
MKYFFLSDSWTTGRVWEFGGLWNENAWKRQPYLQRQSLYIRENGESLWLYKTEEAVLMVEVMPEPVLDPLPQSVPEPTIGQVVLKRLLTAEQVVERLCQEDVFHPPASPLGETPTQQEPGHMPQSSRPLADDTQNSDDKNLAIAPANRLSGAKLPALQKSGQSVMARIRRFANSAVS